MMLEFRNPVPVVTPLGEGYALYVQSGGAFENDIWCVILDDARILHFRSNELRYVGNATLGLQRPAAPPASTIAPVAAGPRDAAVDAVMRESGWEPAPSGPGYVMSKVAESTQRLAAKARAGK